MSFIDAVAAEPVDLPDAEHPKMPNSKTARLLLVKNLLKRIRQHKLHREPWAFGLFRPRRNQKGEVISGQFLTTSLQENMDTALLLMESCRDTSLKEPSGKMPDSLTCGPEMVCRREHFRMLDFLYGIGPLVEENKHLPWEEVRVLNSLLGQSRSKMGDVLDVSLVFAFEDGPVQSLEVLYLKLELLRQKRVKKHKICLEGAGEVLKPLHWKGNKAYDPAEDEAWRLTRNFPPIYADYPLLRLPPFFDDLPKSIRKQLA